MTCCVLSLAPIAAGRARNPSFLGLSRKDLCAAFAVPVVMPGSLRSQSIALHAAADVAAEVLGLGFFERVYRRPWDSSDSQIALWARVACGEELLDAARWRGYQRGRSVYIMSQKKSCTPRHIHDIEGVLATFIHTHERPCAWLHLFWLCTCTHYPADGHDGLSDAQFTSSCARQSGALLGRQYEQVRLLAALRN